MKRWFRRNWLYLAAVLAGAILTPFAVQAADKSRGYSGAVGGEFLIIPLFLLVIQLGKEVKGVFEMITEVEEVGMDEDYGRGAQTSESIR
jgi:hypothetical protein